jgi:hypothetical protein
MMKQLLSLSVFLVFLAACNTVKQTEKKMEDMDLASQKKLKGNWQISDITFPERESYKIKSFQIADAKCFIGSQWNFVPNNNTGSLNINKSDCPQFSSPIVWSINKNGLFTLKFVSKGTKSKSIIQGYKLRVSNLTSNSFELIDDINVEGSQKELVYHFQKQ